MLSKLKISQKIYLISIVQISLIVLISWVAISQMNKIGRELADIAEHNIPLTRSLTLVAEYQLQQAILFERVLLKGILKRQHYSGAQEAFTIARQKMIELTQKTKEEINATKLFITESIPILNKQETVQEFQQLLESLTEVENSYSLLEEKTIHVTQKIDTGNLNKAIKEATEVESFEDELDQKILSILNDVEDFTLNASLQAEQDEKMGLKRIYTTLWIALLFSLLVPIIIGRSITHPIHQLNNRLNEVADGDGDLTLRLPEETKDETGMLTQSFNKLMDTLCCSIITIAYSTEDDHRQRLNMIAFSS
ncbi:hypothetical protein AB835_06190 [Candidatus Endobugula sertula]|uniref:HAMP domain-containing protein n=1 Tax=Candidatus Endobugula sertula TaxID=62101 RepID=A0A1D2QR33_9GAMM|nr:hypothetical protein AB835_06190 [Candidatus Endobugula sertula]